MSLPMTTFSPVTSQTARSCQARANSQSAAADTSTTTWPPTSSSCLYTTACDQTPSAGVLQIEALAQLGGIMMMDAEKAAENPEFFFAGIESCKWRRPVVPGDILVRP